MMTYQLSNLAVQDLNHIRDFTIETWGHQAWIKYYLEIVDCFELIVRNPKLGKDRSLFGASMRSVNCQSHIIFFQEFNRYPTGPVILRIVHKSRHLPALEFYDEIES